jgi:hypothetical protein
VHPVDFFIDRIPKGMRGFFPLAGQRRPARDFHSRNLVIRRRKQQIGNGWNIQQASGGLHFKLLNLYDFILGSARLFVKVFSLSNV